MGTHISPPPAAIFQFKRILDCFIWEKGFSIVFGSAAVSLTRENWVSGKENLDLKGFSIVLFWEKGFSIVFGSAAVSLTRENWVSGKENLNLKGFVVKKDYRLFLDFGTHWARLRRYLAQPHTHVMKALYAVVLTSDFV